jgi:hypothetical protein
MKKIKYTKVRRSTTTEDLVRRRVRASLRRVPAFDRLDVGRRQQLTTNVERLITIAFQRGQGVDFPAFVSGLVKGTFQAVVNASVEQMEAYADLVESATRSVDEFASEAANDDAARERQRLLATMVLMGINRISVTRRGVRYRSIDDD